MPFGATTPKPVMTTLRMVLHLPPAGRANNFSVPKFPTAIRTFGWRDSFPCDPETRLFEAG